MILGKYQHPTVFVNKARSKTNIQRMQYESRALFFMKHLVTAKEKVHLNMYLCLP